MDTKASTRSCLASAYAKRGWPVFPLHSPESGPSRCDCRRNCGKDAAKHPRTSHGLSDSTVDEATVRKWWQMWPNANIAIATGRRSGLVVLDVDPRSGGDESLAALVKRHERLPKTPCVWTGGGGLHYYFAHPGGQVRNSAGKLGAGLDVRGDGGYVVAPPSVHVSGKAYEWAVACDLAPMPGWLLSLIESKTAIADRRPGRSVNEVLAGVPEGERDVELFRMAAKLRAADVPRDVAEELVLKAAAHCRPPFPAPVARSKVANAYKRYPPNPSRVGRRRSMVNLK